jgi:hypothetical protein
LGTAVQELGALGSHHSSSKKKPTVSELQLAWAGVPQWAGSTQYPTKRSYLNGLTAKQYILTLKTAKTSLNVPAYLKRDLYADMRTQGFKIKIFYCDASLTPTES